MPPKRQSLGAPKASPRGSGASESDAPHAHHFTQSLLDDPIIIHGEEQLKSMQKLLADHIHAVKEVGGKPLTRAQRKVVVDKREEFAASVFSQVRSVQAANKQSFFFFLTLGEQLLG